MNIISNPMFWIIKIKKLVLQSSNKSDVSDYQCLIGLGNEIGGKILGFKKEYIHIYS